jgi:ferredoxin
MKIIVDYDLCEANAVCMKVCPEVFRVDENDNLHLITETPDEKLRARVEEAVRRCPRQALKLEG